ncbi:hypothetical protein [Methylobacter sp. S3L5C]|uniref:hypothetical protein n=1 Tax=Methylobacter sp. S3L5C TaxID=2839024 RepID=UPI001FAC5BCF|nr:hypothetical protein [Methylobacter sp. S3L5C]UOA09262.1 hypothetical protein KKZ03_02780 [Methylobacter sp. S3L5C]
MFEYLNTNKTLVTGLQTSSRFGFFAFLLAVYATVWWERSELESLKAEKAILQENIASLDQLKGHIKLFTCDKGPLLGS